MARCRLSTLRCIAQLHSIKPITQYGGGTDIICSLSALLATGRWLELSAAWSGQFLIMVQVCWRGTNSPPALFMSVEKTCIVEWKIFNNISREKSLFEDLSFFSNSYFYMFFKFAFGCIKLSFVGSPPSPPLLVHLCLTITQIKKASTHLLPHLSCHVLLQLCVKWKVGTFLQVTRSSQAGNNMSVIPVCVRASEGERDREMGGGKLKPRGARQQCSPPSLLILLA